jgi:endonuclease G
MSDERGELARQFLQQVAPAPGGGDALESMSAPADRTEALMPTAAAPERLRPHVESAAEKMARGEPLAPPEQFALEAIIIPDKRPAIDIKDGDYAVTHRDWLHLNEEAAKRTIRPALPSIGRIELPDHPSLPYGGTGFVVGEGLLMTNRHVAEIFCAGLGGRGLVFRPGHRAGIDFKREAIGGSQLVEVKGIAMIHPYWDMALLRVEGLPAGVAPLKLAITDPDELIGRDVAVIGYPAFDPRNDARVQNQVFNNLYDVKRLMPGKLNGRAPIRSFGKDVVSAKHDSSTLGGASGSAVLDIASGEIVALHFAGIYLKTNYGVPTADIARDPRIVDAGVNFTGSAQAGAGPWDEWWRTTEGSEAPAAGPAPTPAPAGVQSVTVAANAGAGGHWTIPIEISINVGEAVPAADGKSG